MTRTAPPTETPIAVTCCYCRKVRRRDGSWTRPPALPCGPVSHGLCPDCLRALHPGFADAPADEGEDGPESAR